MFEAINTAAQTVASNAAINFSTVTISDGANRIELSDGNKILLQAPGKYSITGAFGLYNSTSSAVIDDVILYANGSPVSGATVSVTVPDTGYSEAVITKTVNVKPAAAGNTAYVQFMTSTGIVLDNALVDVYKRS